MRVTVKVRMMVRVRVRVRHEGGPKGYVEEEWM